MDEQSSVLYISHHGTKGMRWGIRKYQNKDGSLKPAGRVRYGKGEPRTPVTKSGKPVVTSTESDDMPQPRKKSLSEMNDQELKAQIDRFKLEQEYSKLTRELNPPKEKKVRKLIADMAENSVKNIGTQAMTYAMGSAVNKVCRGVFKLDFDVVNPKKGQKDK